MSCSAAAAIVMVAAGTTTGGGLVLVSVLVSVLVLVLVSFHHWRACTSVEKKKEPFFWIVSSGPPNVLGLSFWLDVVFASLTHSLTHSLTRPIDRPLASLTTGPSP
mmetsp:Transcript_5226/g.12841  ORF Transcript_5226/g.12841 Transcript_5226/m.12841 type:complete len:106 (-) Transcript_5226:1360-1677(-)